MIGLQNDSCEEHHIFKHKPWHNMALQRTQKAAPLSLALALKIKKLRLEMATAEVKKYIDRFKLKLQIFITTFLLIIIFGYLVSFIPIDKFGIKVESNLLEGIYKFATSGVLSILLRKLLFGTDPLAAGKSKESVFFRSLYPSILIQEKFGVDKGAADKLWFDFFNTWSKPNSNHYSHWQTVFERTYMCRLIYYLSKVLMLFFILSLITLLAIIVVNYFQSDFSPLTSFSVGYSIAVIFIYILLISSNRISSKDDAQPTGCWYKYKEISNIERAILNDDILNNAQNYNDASKLIDVLK